jgi:cyclic di-GMP phosphodiesterase
MKDKQPLRLLLIEDSPDDEALITRALKNAGYQVAYRCVSSEAALQVALMESPCDLVICDYHMPRLTPHRALELVKASGQDVPIIIFSGTVQEDVAIELLKAGASDFITKDRMVRLMLAVQRELREKERRAWNRMELEIAYEQTIAAWGRALELRDVYTKGHTERTTDLALRLARAFEISGQEFKNLYHGALLHDIGKMGIPDAVLLKPDVLTDEERRIIEMHPVLACEMLANVPFLKDALDIPCSHHEKWNGTGYPKGLMGEAIPFAARLFAVVDSYDALTSDRPYRASWDKARTIEYLIDERGKSFDSDVVDRFVEMVGRG